MHRTKETQAPTTSSPPRGCRSPLSSLLQLMKTHTGKDACVQLYSTSPCVLLPGRRGVTLGKPDIKVETINKETHSLEEDSGSVSTASRMVKAMYSVSSSGICVCALGPTLFTQPVVVKPKPQINSVTSPYTPHCTFFYFNIQYFIYGFSVL